MSYPPEKNVQEDHVSDWNSQKIKGLQKNSTRKTQVQKKLQRSEKNACGTWEKKVIKNI